MYSEKQPRSKLSINHLNLLLVLLIAAGVGCDRVSDEPLQNQLHKLIQYRDTSTFERPFAYVRQPKLKSVLRDDRLYTVLFNFVMAKWSRGMNEGHTQFIVVIANSLRFLPAEGKAVFIDRLAKYGFEVKQEAVETNIWSWYHTGRAIVLRIESFTIKSEQEAIIEGGISCAGDWGYGFKCTLRFEDGLWFVKGLEGAGIS
jgi:hypothetical protein